MKLLAFRFSEKVKVTDWKTFLDMDFQLENKQLGKFEESLRVSESQTPTENPTKSQGEESFRDIFLKGTPIYS